MMYPPELENKEMTESNTSDSYLDLLVLIGRDGQLRTFLYDNRHDFNFHITNFPFLRSSIPSSPDYGVFIFLSHNSSGTAGLAPLMNILFWGRCNFLLNSRAGICQGTFEIVAKEILWSVRGSYQTIWGPLSRMLHDILDDDHIQWHPPLIGHYNNFWSLRIWTLLPNLNFNLIMRGFHRTFATGATCQQRTLTPPDTWSCPTLGIACVLMSRLISPELVLFPDFWVSNIRRRYFSFALRWLRISCRQFLMV